MAHSAIGLIETQGLVGVIEAADAAVKVADVQLMGFEEIGGGLVSIRFSGDVASVQTAVQAATQAARRISEVISHHVIPGPHADLMDLLEGTLTSAQPSLPERPAPEELKGLPVTHLRRLVRQTPGAQLKGRQVSHANKEALIADLQRAWQEDS
jgi:ethanolamine utilization protein EutM